MKIQFTEYKKYLKIRIVKDKEIDEIIEVSTGLNKNQTVELFKNIRKKLNIDEINKKKIEIDRRE